MVPTRTSRSAVNIGATAKEHEDIPKDANFDDLEVKAISFIASCYGSKTTSSMSDVRFNIWQHKTARGKSESFKLASLPPTSAAFRLHVQRVHYEACLWISALNSDPPEMNLTDFGWKVGPANQILLPVPLPTGTLAAPQQVLNLLFLYRSMLHATVFLSKSRPGM
ncbi:hypothetical protein E2C01_060934 [Portunus trituberculatus]|uniref:Uncharacterized protein n=1 Tax=Portunus trituberculatus TaxID=210409 RepID=A0A5B7H2I8_PORTR|nr:hypothetical protein [Portunus trituberculatus]